MAPGQVQSPPAAAPIDFRMRGREVSRVEGFSDAVFGFALTLLVITLEFPRTVDALLINLHGWMAFGVCFALLMQIWYKHHMFFRRYGLQDGPVLAVNAVLLFVVLLYVYPLRFMFWLLLGPDGDVSRQVAWQSASVGRVREMFLVYGIGFTAIFGLFGALYACAWRERVRIALTPFELGQTWRLMHTQLLVAAVGVLSIVLTLVLPARWLGMAGACYGLVGVVEFTCGMWRGNHYRRFAQQSQAPSATAV